MAFYYKPKRINWIEKDKMFESIGETEKERGLTGKCEVTGRQHRWLLLPQQKGQKQYLVCLDCTEFSHL